jgi:hypothetical protein
MQHGDQPNYTQVFSIVGRALDEHGYHSLILCELEDGFVARITRPDGVPEAVPFPRSDLNNLSFRIKVAERPRVAQRGSPRSFIGRVAGGFEAFLTPFGRQCDHMGVHSVLVVELEDAVLVSYRPRQLASTSDVAAEWTGSASYKLSTVSHGANDSGEPSDYEYLYFEDGVRKLLRRYNLTSTL